MNEEKNKFEQLTVPEALSWWSKNKNLIWGGILVIATLLGGNVDRIDSFVPDGLGKDSRVDEVIVRVDRLEDRILRLEIEGKSERNPDEPNPTIDRHYDRGL
jgi:hypothetical protein